MAHYKNRKPKPFKGCCTICSCRTTDGRRLGRRLSVQEQRRLASDTEQLIELPASPTEEMCS